jgi:hypothetical protein
MLVMMAMVAMVVVPSPPDPYTPPSPLAHLRFIPTRNDLFVSAIPATNKQTAKKTKKVMDERKAAKMVSWLAY